jgi:hypothetical protein
VAKDQRASRDDIFERLDRLLGPEARTVISEAVAHFQTGETGRGLSVLKAFDARLEGVGLYQQGDRKLPGVYRPLTYVEMVLRNQQPEQFTRYIVHASCAHVESALKQAARLGFFDRIRADRLPLGAILKRVEKQLPADLYENLAWLNQRVCNFAKHDFDARDGLEDGDALDAHLFDLDEALTIYLIARRLVVNLEKNFEVGESPPVVNAVWGMANFVISYVLIYAVGDFTPGLSADVLLVGLGALVTAVGLAWHFEHVRVGAIRNGSGRVIKNERWPKTDGPSPCRLAEGENYQVKESITCRAFLEVSLKGFPSWSRGTPVSRDHG